MPKLDGEMIEEMARRIKESIPQVSINCVIFRFSGEALQVPVVKLVNSPIWAIPGGYVMQDEDIETAASRILFEQTQLNKLILSQFGTFGSAGRAFTNEIEGIEELGLTPEIISFISQRFITIGYYSVIGSDKMQLVPGPFFEEVKWIDIKDTGDMALDHSILISEAVKALRSELSSKPLLLSFMPETFTIPELQKLYEAILGRSVDRGNFRQRMLKSNILINMGTSSKKTKSRPPIIYKLDKKKYLNSLTQDVKLGF